jgi:HAD superfamily hydrolase (TIGR01509 family)
LKHIIFDCDGVLVDSEPLSMRADVAIIRKFGIEMTPDEAGRRFIGTTFEAMLEELSLEHGVTFPLGLTEEKDGNLEELFRNELKSVDGVPKLLSTLRNKNISCSVASNSPRARVELALNLTGVRHHFNAITTFEEVAKGKPAPDVYLRALEKAGVHSAECAVIEDSTTGVKSAVAAGLTVYGFTGTHEEPHAHGQKLLELGAKAVFPAFAEIPSI